MLPVMFQNSWMPTVFEDFLNYDWMPRANSTAPAVNVKESEKAYTMELAAPGIKKEYAVWLSMTRVTLPSPSRTNRSTRTRTSTILFSAMGCPKSGIKASGR